MIKFDFETYMKKDLNFSSYNLKIQKIKKKLETNKEMTDWYNLDKCISKEELVKIEKTSTFIKNNCDYFIVIGAGGSVLGAKGVINAFKSYFNKQSPEIIFLGTSLSATYLKEILDQI